MDERMMVVPFGAMYSNTAPAAVDDQWKHRHYKKDPLFELKMEDLARAYWWLTTNVYFRLYASRRVVPMLAPASARKTLLYSALMVSLSPSTDSQCVRVNIENALALGAIM